ncbi:Uncharacterised protein [Candidatus Gugararchaeum adminiculabundum]|nr:Uncharacterised protein [Candidatus Gugararchaeum adminiculabundum]
MIDLGNTDIFVRPLGKLPNNKANQNKISQVLDLAFEKMRGTGNNRIDSAVLVDTLFSSDKNKRMPIRSGKDREEAVAKIVSLSDSHRAKQSSTQISSSSSTQTTQATQTKQTTRAESVSDFLNVFVDSEGTIIVENKYKDSIDLSKVSIGRDGPICRSMDLLNKWLEPGQKYYSDRKCHQKPAYGSTRLQVGYINGSELVTPKEIPLFKFEKEVDGVLKFTVQAEGKLVRVFAENISNQAEVEADMTLRLRGQFSSRPKEIPQYGDFFPKGRGQVIAAQFENEPGMEEISIFIEAAGPARRDRTELIRPSLIRDRLVSINFNSDEDRVGFQKQVPQVSGIAAESLIPVELGNMAEAVIGSIKVFVFNSGRFVQVEANNPHEFAVEFEMTFDRENGDRPYTERKVLTSGAREEVYAMPKAISPNLEVKFGKVVKYYNNTIVVDEGGQRRFKLL